MTNQKETLDSVLRRLAKEHASYETFREAALAVVPERLKPSIGPHLSEFYLDFRYPGVT